MNEKPPRGWANQYADVKDSFGTGGIKALEALWSRPMSMVDMLLQFPIGSKVTHGNGVHIYTIEGYRSGQLLARSGDNVLVQLSAHGVTLL